MVIIYINLVELKYIMLHAMFHDHRTISFVGKFYYIWVWRPAWSRDLDHLYTLFPPPQGGST